MTKLTKKQKELMGWVNKVDEPGTYENESGAFYCECGKWKPFSQRTVEALVEKGLVEIVSQDCSDANGNYGVYFLKPKK